jgi:hypothetical protein
MRPDRILRSAYVLVGMLLLFTGAAFAQVPGIEGTYKLVSRKLADGTTQGPSEVIGLMTFTKTHRNFNIVWKDVGGKFFSLSIMSTYQLTATEYTETLLSRIISDQISGKEIVYDLSGKTQSSPVKMEGGRIQFKLPFEAPVQVFEGGKITSTVEGRSVAVWEKVQ